MRVLAVAPEGSVYFPVGLAYVVAALKNAGNEVDGIKPAAHGSPADTTWLRPHRNRWPRRAVRPATGRCPGRAQGWRQGPPGGRRRHLRARARHPQHRSRLLGVGRRRGGCSATTRLLGTRRRILSRSRRGVRAPRRVRCHGVEPSHQDLDSLPGPTSIRSDLRSIWKSHRGSDSVTSSLADHSRPYPIVASRSCPFQCTFCYHPLGKKYRQRSVDSIMSELEVGVRKYRIDTVDLLDERWPSTLRGSSFSASVSSNSRQAVPALSWGCQMRVDRVTGRLLDMLKDAGCAGMSFGSRAYSPRVLRSLRKRITPEQSTTLFT